MITKINNLSFDHHICSLIICKAIFQIHARGIHRKEESVVSFMHQQNIICSQTQVEDIAHEQIVIIRQLLQVTWLALDQ